MQGLTKLPPTPGPTSCPVSIPVLLPPPPPPLAAPPSPTGKTDNWELPQLAPLPPLLGKRRVANEALARRLAETLPQDVITIMDADDERLDH